MGYTFFLKKQRQCYDGGADSVLRRRWAGSEETGSLLPFVKKLWCGDVWECERCGVVHTADQPWCGAMRTSSRTVGMVGGAVGEATTANISYRKLGQLRLAT